jgi:lipopolysaccharide export system ATP-binding protein
LRATGLAKRYRARQVVKDVSLRVQSGEVVGLLGPNGAGKTTSFNLMVGLIPCDSGSIFLNNQDITDFPMDRRARLGLGYLPQENSVFRKLTVQQNVRAILELRYNGDGRQCDQRLESLLDEFNLSHLAENPAASLSGGERRRVEIARALASEPQFILLDEPFAAIDPISVLELQQLISQLVHKGLGILITDHNVRATLGICDHAYIVNEGQIIAEGSPDEVSNNSRAREVYLGDHFTL